MIIIICQYLWGIQCVGLEYLWGDTLCWTRGWIYIYKYICIYIYIYIYTWFVWKVMRLGVPCELWGKVYGVYFAQRKIKDKSYGRTNRDCFTTTIHLITTLCIGQFQLESDIVELEQPSYSLDFAPCDIFRGLVLKAWRP